MISHEIDYKIYGESVQLLEVELDPNETVIAEAGTMVFMEDGINFETKMGDGTKANSGFGEVVKSILKRVISDESIFLTHFTNHGTLKAKVAFSSPIIGNILGFDLTNYNNEIICQKGAFLCAALGTEVSISLKSKIGPSLFGGEGFVMQKLKGDGRAFIQAGGHLIKKELKADEVLRIDTGCLVAMTSGIDLDIEKSGGLKNMIFGGEGLFLTTLTGSGTVWLQSSPFTRLANAVVSSSTIAGGESKGEGSLLGGIADIFTDD
ncbi:TIGR00266 family protein [Photobacterium kishitanii]|uniref:TIGR00266 family protein n=1 Tax=Photobacterium kishitanii TaxID=318456 RepID=A0A2T3KMI5_9GAMM|nr:TIGR00266 family protein [Photobacterium kishitanii]PSV01001.1 TIGR00266 family protein [Photobacterium kishitanii]